MSTPEFTTADELRLLAVQCSEQAESIERRSHDALFLIQLSVSTAVIDDAKAHRLVNVAIDQAHTTRDDDLPGLIRLCGTILNDRAARIERAQTLAMGEAA